MRVLDYSRRCALFAALSLALASSLVVVGATRADAFPGDETKFCLYEHINGNINMPWDTTRQCFTSSAAANLNSTMNNQASSLKNNLSTPVCIYSEPNQLGYYKQIGPGDYLLNMTKDLIPGVGNWNDRVSSIGPTRSGSC
jgi:Peptidase inhibitor family I36